MAVALAFSLSTVHPNGAQSALFTGPRFPVKVTHDLVFASAPVRSPALSEKPLLLDLSEPAGGDAPRPRPAFVAVHGGGFVGGDKRTDNMVEWCRELAASDRVCFGRRQLSAA